MNLYEKWITMAYDKNGQAIEDVWSVHLPLEQRVYEAMLESKNTSIKGTVSELAERYKMPIDSVVGFLDGISGAVDMEYDMHTIEESTFIDATVDFAKLYQKMVECKATHLYQLPQWNNIFTPEEQKELYVQQRKSTTIVRNQPKIGRNDICPCGSGKKYKKCCGLA